jgi:hypothetical protein
VDDDQRQASPAPERTTAGWALVGGRDRLDVPAVLERHGAVYRWPLGSTTLGDELAPGQPCFLYATDRSRTVGLWAVGSIVAPVLELAAGTPLLPGEAALLPVPDPAEPRRWVEVELLGLEKAIAGDVLAEHPVLGASALFADEAAGPVRPLTRREVRALESLDFWLADPDEGARAALDALLASEDDLLG